MKPNLLSCLIAWTLLAGAAEGSAPPAETRAEAPPLDSAGRFWVYRNGARTNLPFSPYGWMTDGVATNVIRLDTESRKSPHNGLIHPRAPEEELCLQLTVNWTNATWAAVAFISGPDQLAWWGEDGRGKHFDLRVLSKKKLVFHLRGERGGERVKIQVGILGNRKFGDSLIKPITSGLLTLTNSWQQFEIDLSTAPKEELARVCNGFGILVERSEQTGEPNQTDIFLDDAYYE